MMTLQEINNTLNSSVQGLVGKKMDYAEIHAEVKEMINSLNTDFKYNVWDVYAESKFGLNIFTLKLDTLDDARAKHRRIGKIQSIEFGLNFPEFANLTLEEFLKENEEAEKLKYIEQTKEIISRKEKELQDLKEQLRQMENEL